MNVNTGNDTSAIRSRIGWKTQEDTMLWEEVNKAQREGRTLKSVFDAMAQQTGRKPNSIRNYYYARSKEDDGTLCPMRSGPAFMPFSDDEIRMLLKTVLTQRAQGISVRACTFNMGNGDNKAMLRYQNKYRSLIKSNDKLVRKIIEELRSEGIPCVDPYEISMPSVKRVGRPRKIRSESLVEVLSGVVEGLDKVEGVDVTSFFESLGALALGALRGADAIKRLEAMQGESSPDEHMMLIEAQNETIELQARLEEMNSQLEAQSARFNTLLGLFRQLMNVNREFLGLNSVIKVSNLSTYIKELSKSVEDCEKLMPQYV